MSLSECSPRHDWSWAFDPEPRKIDHVRIHPTRPNFVVSRDGRVFREMRQSNINGYRSVMVELRKGAYIHGLVLETFVGPRPFGHQAAHFDGVRTNNHLENLRWATPMQNSQDKQRHGTQSRGTQIISSKMTHHEVIAICEAYRLGHSLRGIARAYGVADMTVRNIVIKRTWKHVERDTIPLRPKARTYDSQPADQLPPLRRSQADDRGS